MSAASINVLNRYRYTKANVASALLAIKKGTEKALAQAPSFLRKYPGSFHAAKGKLTAVAPDGQQLVVIPTEDRDDFLREIVYGKTSEYPFGRDSLFAILKDEVMNVSKRDIEGFLNAQGPLVHRRARPPKQKREHLRQIRNVGQLSIDLAHIKAKDFESVLGEKGHDYMGVPGKRGYQQDRYFLNAVDLLTGYLITEIVQGKTAKEIAPKLSKLIDRYEKQLGQKVKKVEVDKGGEFRGATREMLTKRGIRTIEKITNAAVEQTNAKMQRVFWALVEQRRGGFLATTKQAVKISNRTYNRRIRMSPEDALKKIVAGEKISKKTPKAGPTERKRAWKVGEKVRALKKPRAKGDDLGYKAYKGDHYGAVTPALQWRVPEVPGGRTVALGRRNHTRAAGRHQGPQPCNQTPDYPPESNAPPFPVFPGTRPQTHRATESGTQEETAEGQEGKAGRPEGFQEGTRRVVHHGRQKGRSQGEGGRRG